jgi:hypothetical protein
MPSPRHHRTRLSATLLATALAALAGLTAAETPQPLTPAGGDPTAVVVAQGHQIYRQRDLDALVLIANRYHHGVLSAPDQDQLRRALAHILLAREPLLESLEALPATVSHGKLGDAYLLDLLDYQAETNPTPTAPATLTGPAQSTGVAPASAPPAESEVVGDGPVIVPLPPLVLVRTIAGSGRRQLSMQIALRFADQATSHRFEAQAAVIRDAILGYMDAVTPEVFLEPKQSDLKQGLLAAITAQISDFPASAVLIPQLDAAPAAADAPAAGKPPAPADAAAPVAAPGPGPVTPPAPNGH